MSDLIKFNPSFFPELQVKEDGSLFVMGLLATGEEVGVSRGSVAFTFSSIEEGKAHETNALVSVSCVVDGDSWEFSGRLNILSISARGVFATQMVKPSTKYKLPADIFLSTAIEKVLKHLKSKDESSWFEEITGTVPEHPLFAPFIIENAPNLLFGKGGTGKTYLCLRMALSLITGRQFLGFTPTRKCKVLFVDYEASKGEFYDRFSKLISGLGSDFELSEIMNRIRYFPPLGRPLHEIVPLLKKTIVEHGIDFVLVDSAILACGGEPEKADIAGRYFNALSMLKVTSMTIAHETKAENHAYPFGSVVWWNSPRNIWNAQGMNEVEDEDADVDPNQPIEVGLFHRKANNGPKARMVSTKILFQDTRVSVVLGDPNNWDKEASVSTRILRFLRAKGASKRKDIDSEFPEVEKTTIRLNLQRLQSSGKIILLGGQGGDYCIKK